jgi:hypothetical protein
MDEMILSYVEITHLFNQMSNLFIYDNKTYGKIIKDFKIEIRNTQLYGGQFDLLTEEDTNSYFDSNMVVTMSIDRIEKGTTRIWYKNVKFVVSG